MKKQTKNILPIWIAVLVLGILFQIIGRVLHFPFWLVWLTNLLCWGGTGVWVGLHFILVNKGKLKGSQLFVQNRAVYERVSREINEAISRYLVSVNRTGFLKSSALYERPWFLVCGPKKSGKTQLLLGSGLDFPLKYPSEKDGMILEEGSGISWNFGNDAVWVDMPGIMMENSGKEEWKATVNALCQVRSKRAVDGVVMVVNANRVIESEPGKIKEIASSLRERLDELITTWGIEFPVYLVISRSDEIPGFNELFHEPAGKWNEQILGATLSETQRRTLPRFVFIEEFELLASSLKNMQFRILAREKDAAARRMICRFVIHFEGLQQKLGDFIAEIFKPSSYEGKPVFRGFYFTSCQAVPSDEIVELHTQIDMGNLLIKHPFNPHRSEVTEASASGKSHNIQIRSFFTNPLFNKVIPTGISLVKRTEKFSRKEMIKHYSFIAVIAILMLLLGWHFFLSAKHSIGLNNKIEKEIIQTKSQTYSRLEAYKMLGRMGDMISLLKKIDDKRMPFLIGVGLYRGECVFNALKKEYFTKLKKLIVGPSMRFMEYKIKGYTSSFGELSSEDYNELYKH